VKHSNILYKSRPDHKFSTSVSSSTISQSSFSEEQIIELSDKFLTNGFHHIEVESVEHGRIFMTTFLNSLNYYHDVAVLSSDASVMQGHTNIFSVLVQEDLITKPSYNFTEFLCNNFYYDFLWIEVTSDLKDATWFKHFEQDLLSLNFDKIMPIMVLSY
jgi:hypothetical protein